MIINLENIKTIEPNNLYCGNAVTVLSNFPENFIDLIVTSPPYDDNKIRTYKGFVFDFESMAKEIYRIMKPGGVVVWVVGDATNKGESGTSFRQALFFQSLGFLIHDTMIYQKNSSTYPSGIKSNRFSQIFEYMFVFSKDTAPKTSTMICDKKNRWGGWKSFGQASQRSIDGTLVPFDSGEVAEYGVRNNIWTYYTGKGYSSKDTIASGHPAIFPYLLPFDHIRVWSNKGDIVLDPMNGSGSTCLMAKVLERQYIGIDISSEYCEIAEQRIENSQIYIVDELIAKSTKEYSSRDPQEIPTKTKIEIEYEVKLF